MAPDRWMDALSDEDRTFLKRFVLASGSLKEMARIYRVSYPTVRLRLDRLIQKIQVVDEHGDAGPFEQALRVAHAEGRIDIATMKSLLTARRQELSQETDHETSPTSSPSGVRGE